MRGIAWRRYQQEKVVKHGILEVPYAKKFYLYRFRRHGVYSIRHPYGGHNWFSYLGEFTPVYKKSTNSDGYISREREYGYVWSHRYMTRRSKLRMFIRKELNDEIGTKYFISNKF